MTDEHTDYGGTIVFVQVRFGVDNVKRDVLTKCLTPRNKDSLTA